MRVKYEHKSAMTFIGYSTTIKHEEGYSKCPEFWDKEYTRKYARLWQTMKPESPIEKAILENHIGLFGICNANSDSFDYWIAGIYRGGDVPEGLKLFELPESDWALFSTTGALPKSLQELNDRVWQSWYPNEGKELMGGNSVSLEFYSPGDMQNPDYECGIWVPIERMPAGNN